MAVLLMSKRRSRWTRFFAVWRSHTDVLMVAPSAASVGGMNAVAQALAENLPPYRSCRLIDGGGGRGLRGYLRFPAAILYVALADYQLLHVHVASGGSTLRKGILCEIARLRAIPYVIHLHGAGYFQFTEKLNPVALRIVRRLYRGAGAVIVLGQGWYDLVAGKLQVPEARIQIVHNGVPAITATLGVDAGRSYLVFLGVVDYRKGVDVLLASLERLLSRSEFQSWEAEILGPEGDPALVAEAKRLAVRTGGRVHVRGPVSGQRKAELLAGASIFCLPSRMEALPMSILEALGAGVPCVCTDVGSIGEVIRDGVDGVLVPAGDANALSEALAALMTSEPRRRLLGARGHARWVEGFSADRMVSDMIRIWEEVEHRRDLSRR